MIYKIPRFHFSLLLFLFLPAFIFSRQIDTFYGPLEVEETVLLELIDSEPMQRLKDIRQYGVSYYTSFNEEYNRYDHSIGVFAILRKNNASLKEQIAGLLHDASHTVFSHVGDWVFQKEYQEKDYQNDIHLQFLQEKEIGEILNKYGITLEEIEPTAELFPALECSLPNLCADRIDYNIQGAYHQKFITYTEAIELFESLNFIDNMWISDKPLLMKKIAKFALFMTEHCWGSPSNHLESRFLADALIRAIELKDLSYEDLHYGKDQEIWDLLSKNTDKTIQKKMSLIKDIDTYYYLSTEEPDLIIKSKFRGIDPLISINGTISRLSALDPLYASEYASVQKKCNLGWNIKFTVNQSSIKDETAVLNIPTQEKTY